LAGSALSVGVPPLSAVAATQAAVAAWVDGRIDAAA